MKSIIFDSGTLITFSMNCMLDVIKELKKNFHGKFLITKEVEYEIVKHPMTIKKYKLGALRLKCLIDEKILEFPESLNISSGELQEKTKQYLKRANSVFYKGNMPLQLIDLGEASCLALSSVLSEKGVKNAIAIDERTTRMLFEKPENLKNLLEMKLHTKVSFSKFNSEKFEFIRSSELVYVAFKKNLIKDKSKEMLDAMLYGVKFKGCAISTQEIKELEKMS